MLITLLQWGHAFVSVETGVGEAVFEFESAALQWGHAFVSVETHLRGAGNP